MITIPISASSPYRSYSDGSKLTKEPLASEDHPPNVQVRVHVRLSTNIIASSVTISFLFIYFFEARIQITFDTILGISELRKFRNYINTPVIGNDVACLFTCH